MSKVMFLPNMMWLCIAASLAAASKAITVPLQSRRNKRDAMKATGKQSQLENEIVQPRSMSSLDKHANVDNGFKHGFKLAVELRTDDAMEKFIRRFLHAYGKTVNDEGALQGFVPWFSGTKATQNFSQMKEQLFKKPWVVDASDLSDESPASRDQLAPRNIRAPYRLHAGKCNSQCIAGKSRHRCKLRDCQACPECTTRQNLLPAKDIAKQNQTLWEDGFIESEPQPYGAQPSVVEVKRATITNSSAIGRDTPMIQYLQQYVHQYADDPAPAPVSLTSLLPAPSPVRPVTKPNGVEERLGANSSHNEANGITTATNPVGQETLAVVPSQTGSATVSVAATPTGSVETPPAMEDLMLGVHSLINSQSQIANDIASKIVELKANVGKAESSNRESLDEVKSLYQGKLVGQYMNTTLLRDRNKHLEEDIKVLLSINAGLRQQAQELKQQSLALRMQVTAAEANLTLAQEFAAKALIDDSKDEFQLLNDLRRNESELAKARTHKLAVDHIGEKSEVAFLQFENDTEPVQLLHTVENSFSELSAQANASKLALEKSFEQSFNQEAMIQESILAKQRALLDEKEEQLALRSKLTDAVAHADQIKTYLNNRLLHLRSYAIRLSRQ